MTDPDLVPQYVPPHLRGQVFDFKNEPGGAISFYHPQASMGLDPERSRVTLPREQYKQTFDPVHRALNMRESVDNQYALRKPKTGARVMNEGIANFLRGAFDWGTSSQGKAVGTAGLLGALGGGLGGLVWGKKSGRPIRKALLLALLGAGGAAGLTALSQHRYNNQMEATRSGEAKVGPGGIFKSASMEVSQAIILALNNDPMLGHAQRAEILRALSRVDNRQRDELYRLLRTSIGAGAGMLAMRFLGAKGLLPMLAGGIVGGMIGHPGRPKLQRNPLGQIAMQNYL